MQKLELQERVWIARLTGIGNMLGGIDVLTQFETTMLDESDEEEPEPEPDPDVEADEEVEDDCDLDPPPPLLLLLSLGSDSLTRSRAPKTYMCSRSLNSYPFRVSFLLRTVVQ